MAEFAIVENVNASIKFLRMSLSFKSALLYIPAIAIFLFVLYRVENFPLYSGSPAMIPPGTYNIIKQNCMHSKVEFDYTKPFPEDQIFSKQSASFLALYGGDIIRKVVVTQNELAWVVGNQSCMFFVRRNIKQNANGKLVLSNKSELDRVPANCTLHYKFRGKAYEEGFGSEVKESLGLIPSLVEYKVFDKGEGFLLYEETFDDHSDLGCLSSDRLITHLEQIQGFN